MPRRPVRRSHNLPRFRAVTMGAVGALMIGLLTTVSSNAAVGDGLFEQDGNADDATVGGADWNSIQGDVPNNGTPVPFRMTGVLSDSGAGEEIFTGGGSKDDLDITAWARSTGSVPDKDDITNAYAAAYSQNDDTIVTFGLDRFAQNGDANVGFWFLKDNIPEPLPAGGGFGMEHSVGDILVLSEYSSGGDVSSIRVLEWNPAQATINGTLRELPAINDPECDPSGVDIQEACGIANDAPVTVDWDYQAKDRRSAPRSVPAAGFFEGAINLTELLGTTDPRAACFSTFLAETRSSTSVDATLKDFVLGEFALCQPEVNISPTTDGNSIDESHTFTVTATNSVAGSTGTPITVGHVDVTLTTVPLDMSYTLDTTLSTCHVNPTGTDSNTDNLDGNGQCTVVITKAIDSGTITATATLTSGFGSDTTESTETGTNGPATKVYFDGTLKWQKRAGTTTGAHLGGATFEVCRVSTWDSGDPPGDNGELVSNVVVPPVLPTPEEEADYICPAADLQTVVDDESATDNPDVVPDSDDTAGEFQLHDQPLGRYRIVETVAPAGYALDGTPQYLDLTATSTTPAALVFADIPQFKLIVITCDTTNALVDSTVTLDKDPSSTETDEEVKETLKAAPTGGPTAEELCTLGGANFSPLPGGDYSPTVELPDIAPLHPTP